MGRAQLGIAFFLVLCIVVFAETATVYASSESFPLVQSASVTRDVFANQGDRLVGSFTIFDIPTWTDTSTGNPQTVEYAFKITKVEGPANCPYETELYGAYQKETATFDLYCNYTGNFRLRFNVGSGNPTTGIGNMGATLNYEVVKSSSDNMQVENPATAGEHSNGFPSPSIPELSYCTVVIVMILATTVILVIQKRKVNTSSIFHVENASKA